jgi:hypothetical protein
MGKIIETSEFTNELHKSLENMASKGYIESPVATVDNDTIVTIGGGLKERIIIKFLSPEIVKVVFLNHFSFYTNVYRQTDNNDIVHLVEQIERLVICIAQNSFTLYELVTSNKTVGYEVEINFRELGDEGGATYLSDMSPMNKLKYKLGWLERFAVREDR